MKVERERVLAEVVRAWVSAELPGQPGAAERAAAVAAAAYLAGASVDEACHDAIGFVGSWMRHPSHAKVNRNGLVALAS